MNLVLPVISCSLDPRSHSRGLAERCARILYQLGHDAPVVDLAEGQLPLFDNASVFESPDYARLHHVISSSDGVVLAFPIYNWAPNAAVKSLIESTGATGEDLRVAAWFDKLVTFVCAAGLPHSYMATGQLGHSLMTDFKCVINPYIAYVAGDDWSDDQLSDDRSERLDKTMRVHAELATLLSNRGYTSDWEV